MALSRVIVIGWNWLWIKLGSNWLWAKLRIFPSICTEPKLAQKEGVGFLHIGPKSRKVMG